MLACSEEILTGVKGDENRINSRNTSPLNIEKQQQHNIEISRTSTFKNTIQFILFVHQNKLDMKVYNQVSYKYHVLLWKLFISYMKPFSPEIVKIVGFNGFLKIWDFQILPLNPPLGYKCIWCTCACVCEFVGINVKFFSGYFMQQIIGWQLLSSKALLSAKNIFIHYKYTYSLDRL